MEPPESIEQIEQIYLYRTNIANKSLKYSKDGVFKKANDVEFKNFF